MRKLMRASAIVAAATVLLGGTALAQFQAPESSVSGTMVGNTGGAFQTWNVNAPKDTDVTLTLNHWPCNTGDAVGLEAWGKSGMLGMSSAADACTQVLTFNTGAGGPIEVKQFNYLDGVGTWWMLSGSGVNLPGATAMTTTTKAAPAMAETKPATTAMTTGGATTMTTAPAAAAKPAAAAQPAMAPAAATLDVNNAVLYGEAGGAFGKYDLMVKKGTTYDAMLQTGSPNGGSWPGTGLEVYGPDGLVTSAGADNTGAASAQFTAGGDDKYYVVVYNYHAGVPIFYHLGVKPAQ
jgi:hypothetical protein